MRLPLNCVLTVCTKIQMRKTVELLGWSDFDCFAKPNACKWVYIYSENEKYTRIPGTGNGRFGGRASYTMHLFIC